MVDANIRWLVLIIVLVAVIILSGLFYVQYTKQGSADLTITSAIVKPAYQGFNNYTNYNESLYTVNINLHIKFNGQMRVEGYLNPCSFFLALNSSIWNAPPTTCTGIIGEHSYSGSQDFTINVAIETSTINTTISPPFNLSFMVFSNVFNVSSQYYNLSVTSSSELQASLEITHVSLDNFTKQTGATGYNINTMVLLTSNHAFNISSYCPSPFTLIFVNNLTTSSLSFPCNMNNNIHFPSGTSEYNLTTQFFNPSNQKYNSVSSFWSNATVQVILGNYFLKSNVYNLTADLPT